MSNYNEWVAANAIYRALHGQKVLIVCATEATEQAMMVRLRELCSSIELEFVNGGISVKKGDNDAG